MDKVSLLRKWLEIDYIFTGQKLGFVSKYDVIISKELITQTMRCLDRATTVEDPVDVNIIIAIIALMWEHIDKSVYNLKDFSIKILTRIGYPTSAIITDKHFDSNLCQFSPTYSVIDRYILTMRQAGNEVTVADSTILLTDFQKNLWDAVKTKKLIGVSAPTSAGKSFVLLAGSVNKLLSGPYDIIYIVPTLSLLNQVIEDYQRFLRKTPLEDYFITSSLDIGVSKAAHTIYVLTQEKAISTLSSEEFSGFDHKTIIIVDEIQNIERITEGTDVRAKILYDTLQELRHASNVEQIIISGPRINRMSDLGKSLFGVKAYEVETQNSPVLNLTYSIVKKGNDYYMKQYCGLIPEPYEQKIENSSFIAGYGSSKITKDYISYLSIISNALSSDQNIIFAPTASTARDIAIALAEKSDADCCPELTSLIEYYNRSVNPHYSLCVALEKKCAYHHGKLPIHVRRTLEKAVKEKLVSTIICTTTLMQGVNLPTQNVIIRNPHLYRTRREDKAELTSYEMANLRGRAGRLLKDFIGRTYVLDETEFENTESYDQLSLFGDTQKELSSGYGEKFDQYKDDIIDVASTNNPVTPEMSEFGYLVVYIRQSILKYGESAKARMQETGVKLTKEQVAAIIKKLDTLTIPHSLCFRNRYWDPVTLNYLYRECKLPVPSNPIERGALKKLSDILKFLRDNSETSGMYQRHIPTRYSQGQSRSQMCSLAIQWASEVPLSDLLSSDYYNTSDHAADRIEDAIELTQKTISFDIPLLIKPIVEMRNESSSIVACMQAGAYNPCTRKMIEIGVPRELAISTNKRFFSSLDKPLPTDDYELSLFVRDVIKANRINFSYWEKVQLEFLEPCDND